jgi:L,D-peptidoglycan transpeptidase YkuD (ErfK/YbiS/YcfS/YnhG family)
MIIINKSGYLKYKNFKLRCSLGKAGIKKKEEEGDNITPKGIYKPVKVLYRSDKINIIKTNLRKIKIKKNMGWCDDPRSNLYNKQIKLPSVYRHEKLYRKDGVYDIIIVLNYNMNPIIKGKGSAIFIHITKNYKPTQGCIALKKIDLIKILKLIKKNTKIKIVN